MNTLLSALRAVHQGRTSAAELTEAALHAADRHDSHNAMAELAGTAARERARVLDRAPEPVGPLHGAPVTVKDLFAVRGIRMRAGTRAPMPAPLSDPDTEALAVSRLRAAGAVVLGSTNMVEIALGITGENPVTGDVGNATDPEFQAGGSSSGSAVAVALGIGLASVGSDTAGSIRIPAAFNGLVGVKPSYRLVPLDGALALSVTCDHGGPITRTVADARLVLSVLAGRDLAAHPVDAPTLGVPWRFLDGRLGSAVRERFGRLVDRLGAAGARLVEVAMPDVDALMAAYPLLSRPEAARVHRAALEADPDLFTPPVRDALLEGRRYPATDYLAARQVRADSRQVLAAELSGVDALLLPSAPLPAPRRGTTEVELESGPVAHRAAFLPLTLPFSVIGVPAVSLPFDRVDGRPVGVQLVAPMGTDARLLDLAEWLEARVSTVGT